MKEWQIKYKHDGYEHTEIYECDLEKASDVWNNFRIKCFDSKLNLYLLDIRIIQELK